MEHGGRQDGHVDVGPAKGEQQGPHALTHQHQPVVGKERNSWELSTHLIVRATPNFTIKFTSNADSPIKVDPYIIIMFFRNDWFNM